MLLRHDAKVPCALIFRLDLLIDVGYAPKVISRIDAFTDGLPVVLVRT